MVKNKIITTRTTEDLHRRFMTICEKKGLKGDDWIVLFVGNFENEQDYIRSQLAAEKMKIKNIDRQIDELESQKIISENLIEELNQQKIDDGSSDIDKAVSIILERYDQTSVGDLDYFLKTNRNLVQLQAYLANISEEELCEIVVSYDSK